MAALTAPRTVDTKLLGDHGAIVSTFKIANAVKIYQGAFVHIAADGYIQGVVSAVGAEGCLGIALETVDNTGGADGAKSVEVMSGAYIEHAVTAVVTNIGDPVYASDDQTLTLTATNNAFVGWIVNIVATNKALIRMAYPGAIS